MSTARLKRLFADVQRECGTSYDIPIFIWDENWALVFGSPGIPVGDVTLEQNRVNHNLKILMVSEEVERTLTERELRAVMCHELRHAEQGIFGDDPDEARNAEDDADKYATKHGYGEDLISAMEKLKNVSDQVFKDMQHTGVVRKAKKDPNDPHKSNEERAAQIRAWMHEFGFTK